MTGLIATIALAPKLVIDTIDVSNLSTGEQKLFSQNIENFREVEIELTRRGYGNRKCLIAIHANIWHESKGDPNTVSGQFAGLFQIGGNGTMGHGTTKEQRKHIPTAVNIVASKDYFVSWYKKHKYRSTTVREASEGFARNVLRCHSRHVSSRGLTARGWNSRR